MEAKHTPGPWVVGTGKTKELDFEVLGVGLDTNPVWTPVAIIAPADTANEVDEANAHLISAAPDLVALARNFEINGPDDDNLMWLALPGNGTSGMAMFNLGHPTGLAGQVALMLEQDRRAALAKAGAA